MAEKKTSETARSEENKTTDAQPAVEQPSDRAPDPFANLAALRLEQDYQNNIGVLRVLTTVPVGKPGRQDFIRVHPDTSYRFDTMILELKEDREVYLVAPNLWALLADELSPVTLYTAVNRQGTVRVWPVKLPGPDGKENPWHVSAHQAAAQATKRWTRVAANMAIGSNEVHVATGELSPPKWPSESFQEILRIAFRGRYIDGPDHPVVMRLRGEA